MPVDKNVPHVRVGQRALSPLTLSDFDDLTLAYNHQYRLNGGSYLGILIRTQPKDSEFGMAFYFDDLDEVK